MWPSVKILNTSCLLSINDYFLFLQGKGRIIPKSVIWYHLV